MKPLQKIMFKNVFILKFTLFMFPQVKTPFSPSQKKPIWQLPKYEKLESQKMAHPITQPTKVLQNSPPPPSQGNTVASQKGGGDKASPPNKNEILWNDGKVYV